MIHVVGFFAFLELEEYPAGLPGIKADLVQKSPHTCKYEMAKKLLEEDGWSLERPAIK